MLDIYTAAMTLAKGTVGDLYCASRFDLAVAKAKCFSGETSHYNNPTLIVAKHLKQNPTDSITYPESLKILNRIN